MERISDLDLVQFHLAAERLTSAQRALDIARLQIQLKYEMREHDVLRADGVIVRGQNSRAKVDETPT